MAYETLPVRFLRPFQYWHPGTIANLASGFARTLERQRIVDVIDDEPLEMAVAPAPVAETAEAPLNRKMRRKNR